MFDYGAKIDVFSFKYFFNTLLVKPFKKLKEWLNGEKLPTLTRIPFSTNKRKMSMARASCLKFQRIPDLM